MNKLKAMIAVALILPLAGWASSLTVEGGGTTAMTAPSAKTCNSAQAGPQNQYVCCWIWMMGSWRCVPCD